MWDTCAGRDATHMTELRSAQSADEMQMIHMQIFLPPVASAALGQWCHGCMDLSDSLGAGNPSAATPMGTLPRPNRIRPGARHWLSQREGAHSLRLLQPLPEKHLELVKGQCQPQEREWNQSSVSC